jgi:hypothetical protein
MNRRKNFGRLLDSFADRKTKPETADKALADIRLPSWTRLLEIDREAEAAAAHVDAGGTVRAAHGGTGRCSRRLIGEAPLVTGPEKSASRASS